MHARGAGAYGYFEPYDDSFAEYTVAKFLTTPGKQTPVFVRFSTVAGSRGSADTVHTDVVVANGVVSTTAAADDLSDQFTESFASALAQHRAWEREADPVPA